MTEGSLFLTGSICLDDILAALKGSHSAFSKSEKNGKTYIALKQWVNEDEDQYGNHSSISLNSDKNASAQEKEKKWYIGNMKKQKTGGAAVTADEAANMAKQFEAASGSVKTVAAAPSGSNGSVQAQVVSGPPAPARPGVVDDGLPF